MIFDFRSEGSALPRRVPWRVWGWATTCARPHQRIGKLSDLAENRPARIATH
jgi:hypothetical protein